MARMHFFLLASLALLLALSATASAQQVPIVGKESAGACDRFKMRVMAPSGEVDYKMPVVKPPEGIDYKGIVIDPCKTEPPKIVRSLLLVPDKGKGQWPSFITPSLKPPPDEDRTLKSPAEMLKKSMPQSGRIK